jgi:general stress protein 26
MFSTANQNRSFQLSMRCLMHTFISREENKEAYDLLTSFSVGMLVTKTKTGCHVRPMAIAEVLDECSVTMIVDVRSEKAEEIRAEPYALVSFQEGSSYMVIEGQAQLEDNKLHLQELWTPHFEAWFPQGIDDPNIQLLTIKGERGEYWKNEGVNKVRYAYQVAKAYLTGTTPELDEGSQHGVFEKEQSSIPL